VASFVIGYGDVPAGKGVRQGAMGHYPARPLPASKFSLVLIREIRTRASLCLF
jgi:hypothetical protein